MNDYISHLKFSNTKATKRFNHILLISKPTTITKSAQTNIPPYQQGISPCQHYSDKTKSNSPFYNP